MEYFVTIKKYFICIPVFLTPLEIRRSLKVIHFAFIFSQVSLLDVFEKIKHGCITGEKIRAELKAMFPGWNIQSGKTGGDDKVTLDNAFCES